MLGMPVVAGGEAQAPEAPPPAAPAKRPSVRPPHGTMLGMPAVQMPPPGPAALAAPPGAATLHDAFAPTHPPAAPNAAAFAPTEEVAQVTPAMVAAAHGQPAMPAYGAPAPVPAAPHDGMLASPFAGMASPNAALPGGLATAPVAAPQPLYAAAPEATPAAPPQAFAPQPFEAPASSGRPSEAEHVRGPGMGPVRPAASPATPNARPYEDAAPEFTRPSPRSRHDVTYEEPSESAPVERKPARGIAGLVVAGFLGMAALTAIGAALYVAFHDGDDLRAEVATVEGEQQLVVDVRAAAPGTKVRFQGREVPITSGRAVFPLAPDSLRLGENDIALDVLSPDGKVDSHHVVISLAFRVRADLGGLDDDPPVLRVIVDAKPGSSVTLDGEPLALDATGRGAKSVPVEAATEGQSISHATRYRIVPPGGTPVEGSIETRMPLAMLHLDRPGTSLVTDRAEVEIAGTVGPRATIVVGDRTVATLEGRFFTRWPLPTMGDQDVTLRVREPDKAPRRETIHLRRVPDLAAEAARYPVERDLDYARLAQNPSTYRGRHVAFEGFAYHVEVADGRSVLQILVRDCPGGQRCPLWVTYPAATDAVRSSWVRVVGEVAGEQQFRAANGGQILTVPRVDAAFVLPVSR